MSYGIRDVDPALDPPMCSCGEYAPEPGEVCQECNEYNPTPDEIEDLRAEAAIARIEDDRMFPEPEYDWEPS